MTNLEKWNFYLQDFESPQIYIDWTFYFAIGAALERRVWYGDLETAVFPNMYVVAIGPSRVGKSAPALQMKHQVFKKLGKFNDKLKRIDEKINLGPDSLTLEKLITDLHKKYKTLPIPQAEGETGPPKIYTYSALAFMACSELGTLFKKDTNDLIRFLTEGWECGDFEKRLKTGEDESIKNMCVSLFGAATPDWLRDAIKTQLFNEGFGARTIFIYANKKRKHVFQYRISDAQRQAISEIRDHIEKLTDIYGPVHVPEHVQEWLNDWYLNRNKAINLDKKLSLYYANKKLHLIKMIIVVHFARTTEDVTITIEDCEEALNILNKTEVHMNKALSGVGVNPLATLAAGIYDYLEERKQVRRQELVVNFFGDCPNRSMVDIDNAVNYLCDSNMAIRHKLDPTIIILAEGKIAEKENELFRRAAEAGVEIEEIKKSQKVIDATQAVQQVKQTQQTKKLMSLQL